MNWFRRKTRIPKKVTVRWIRRMGDKLPKEIHTEQITPKARKLLEEMKVWYVAGRGKNETP